MPASPDADVVIVGAGLAGLSAALELTRLGRRVILLEAANRAGGRVVTDLVDGFRLDRGFQLVNPAYPRLRRLVRTGVLDPDQLELRQFAAGVRVALDGRHRVLADPRRSPRDLPSTLRGLGSPLEQARFARWALRCLLSRPADLLAGPDEPYGQRLDRAGVRGPLRTGVLEPFLAGVLGEQLAAALPAGALRLGTPVEAVTGSTVRSVAGPLTGRAVLVATDPATAAALTGLPRPELRSLTTFWFAAERSPEPRPILHLDGLRRGPVANTAVLSAAAPAYSPDGRALIAASMVGLPAAGTEQRVRRQLELVYGTGTAGWQLLRVDAIGDALPAMRPPLAVRQPVRLTELLFVAGDHRDTASQQGALASGARAAAAIHQQLA
ncbi:FAD-dependent oxidoreductase [Jatrophihabitans sp.]|jgi:glycine/D-amino acid oxidase-like deaminating enzyme|uniref:FAD-dependent oxidoreductase n=1 Tax=Jatrophihabitans sp. TaxID=1932789 RepID=UPI002F117407